MSRSTTSKKTRSLGPLAVLAAAVLLVVAMAGSATAAALITGKDVKNGSLTGKDVKDRSLTGKDVKDRSLTGADVKDQGLTGADVKDGSLSGKDVQDGTVAEGDLGASVKAKLNAPNVAGYEVVTETVELESDGEGAVFVACSAGKVAVGGGGAFADAATTTTSIEASLPQKVIRGDSLLFADPEPGFADGWRVDGKHSGLDPQDLTAYVVCVDPS